jgi:hypothetical protein
MMMTEDISQIAKEVVRRNTIEVQGGGNWALFDELFDDNFHDHTPQPGGKPDKVGVLMNQTRHWTAFVAAKMQIESPAGDFDPARRSVSAGAVFVRQRLSQAGFRGLSTVFRYRYLSEQARRKFPRGIY